jgi:hypothetical protein
MLGSLFVPEGSGSGRSRRGDNDVVAIERGDGRGGCRVGVGGMPVVCMVICPVRERAGDRGGGARAGTDIGGGCGILAA